MAAFIKNFLSHRTFTVQHGNSSLDIYKPETGVPQGSILCYTIYPQNQQHYRLSA